jgi:hypothetical protein
MSYAEAATYSAAAVISVKASVSKENYYSSLRQSHDLTCWT